MAAMASKGKEGSAITTGVHHVNGDLDAILDLQDQVVHAPVHGTVIMPRLAARTVNPWATGIQQRKLILSVLLYAVTNDFLSFLAQEMNPLFPMTIEDNYVPAQQFSDSLIVMVDDPVVVVGQKPS